MHVVSPVQGGPVDRSTGPGRATGQVHRSRAGQWTGPGPPVQGTKNIKNIVRRSVCGIPFLLDAFTIIIIII